MLLVLQAALGWIASGARLRSSGLAGQAKHLWQETAHGGEHTCQEGYQYGPDLNIALT
jgi:hypothetical protein